MDANASTTATTPADQTYDTIIEQNGQAQEEEREADAKQEHEQQREEIRNKVRPPPSYDFDVGALSFAKTW